MKIRNKKTGEIVEYDSIGFRKGLSDGWEDFIAKANSLAELNECFEDYEQKEPLIEDEVLRNLVRTWAKEQDIKEVVFDKYWLGFRCENSTITVWGHQELEDGKTYTIEELCGYEDNN